MVPVEDGGGASCSMAGLIISVLSALPADAEHLPGLLQKNTKKLENLLMSSQSGSGGAPVSVLHGGAERGSGSWGGRAVAWPCPGKAYLDMPQRDGARCQGGSLLPALLTPGDAPAGIERNVLAVRRKVESIWRKK